MSEPNIAADVPKNDVFSDYIKSLSKMLKNCEPHLTIGVFGDWGVGKTSFLKSLANELDKDESIITVFFNAWRYEREEEYAIIPLLKSMYFAIDSNSSKFKDVDKVQRLKEIFRRVIDTITQYKLKNVTISHELLPFQLSFE
ncbi:MAG: hypothetical protein D6752_00045, partial [Candidatus Nitrosothermus koennekii]